MELVSAATDTSGPALRPFIISKNGPIGIRPRKCYSKPEIRRAIVELENGALGMPGGPNNPLGACALYLYQNNRDTLYRIHGTNEPWTIGTNVSSGCIRLTNADVTDLYDRVAVGSKVVVLS